MTFSHNDKLGRSCSPTVLNILTIVYALIIIICGNLYILAKYPSLAKFAELK